MRSDEGFTSIGALLLILFLSVAVLGVMAYSRNSGDLYNRAGEKYEARERLGEAVHELISVIADDPTPEADSLRDPVWTWLQSRGEEQPLLELEDISSRFNLNFVRTKMLEESVFGSMMLPGRSPEGLKLHRGEAGFAQNLAEGYGEYYSEEDLEAYFTLYSYANLNVTYEDSLKKLYEIRVSEAGSHSFLSKIQSLVSRLVPADGEELERILGSDYDDLYPLINIEPLINVNFAHKEILRAVLYYPYGGERVEHASDYLDILTAERTTMEIAPEKLDITLALEGPSLRIRDYLGTNTWFWKITASEGDLRLEAVICRIPGEADEEPLYRIIEWKYY